jgi:glycosyltransferase involved in cell wall biosynthesis
VTSGSRFDPIDGTALVPMPPFVLTERAVEILTPGDSDLWIVVAAFNEVERVRETLDALARQVRPAVVCLVDNASTDATVEIVRAWATVHPDQPLRLVHEPEKGTGAAADTGIRVAMATGARLVLRTDADCLPAPDWSAHLADALDNGLDLAIGRTVPRTDLEPLHWWEPGVIEALMHISDVVGWLRPSNRGPDYRTRFRLCIGNNLGVRSEMYGASGGFPRSRIEEVHEDRALMNRMRRITPRIGTDRRAVVATSIRRLRAYGLVGILRWYLDHGGGNGTVDVR